MADEEFSDLLARARGGDASAVECLLRGFEPEVRLMVRARLPRVLRGQFDSMDFVQAVWQSVFAGPEAGVAGLRAGDEGQFRGYLAGVAHHKVLQEYRKRTRTRKYDLSREEPLYVRRQGRDEPRAVAGADASPSAEAQAGDILDRLTVGKGLAAQAVELRRQGLSCAEVGARLGTTERSIRRLLEGLLRRVDRAGGGG